MELHPQFTLEIGALRPGDVYHHTTRFAMAALDCDEHLDSVGAAVGRCNADGLQRGAVFEDDCPADFSDYVGADRHGDVSVSQACKRRMTVR